MCRIRRVCGLVDRRVLRNERLPTPPGPEGSNGTEPSSGAATDLAINEATTSTIMSYIVLARKWRPQTFGDLVGQDSVTRTLKNAITLQRISHAILLTGSRGVGKTTSARIFAKALNCEKGPTIEPCLECANCKEIAAGSSPDVLEIDGASNTRVDEIREVLDNVRYRPQKSLHKIYIVDEVHMLSTHSFNALLKTLEEPPDGVMFIFATTEPHKIPDTILSRCQRFDLRQLGTDQIISHLRKIVTAEKIQIDDGALALLARQAAGSMRDALSLLDQVLAFSGEKIAEADVVGSLGLTDRELIHRALETLLNHDSAEALEVVGEVFLKGYDPKTFVLEIWERVRDLLLLRAGADAKLVHATEEERKTLATWARQVDEAELERWFDLLKIAAADVSRVEFPRYVIDVTFLKATRVIPRIPLSEIVERLEAVTSGKPSVRPTSTTPVSGGGPVRMPPTPTAPASGAAPSAAPAKSTKATFAVSVEALVNEVKRQKPSVAAILLQAAKMGIDGSTLEIIYNEGSFQLGRAKEDDFRICLEAISAELFGTALKVDVKSQAKVVSNAPSPVALDREREREALDNPIVKRALSLFEARIEEIKPIK